VRMLHSARKCVRVHWSSEGESAMLGRDPWKARRAAGRLTSGISGERSESAACRG
jgi:hypothetical protein